MEDLDKVHRRTALTEHPRKAVPAWAQGVDAGGVVVVHPIDGKFEVIQTETANRLVLWG